MTKEEIEKAMDEIIPMYPETVSDRVYYERAAERNGFMKCLELVFTNGNRVDWKNIEKQFPDEYMNRSGEGILSWLKFKIQNHLPESGEKWIDVKDRLPEVVDKKMKPVLGFNGKRIIKVYYFPDRFKSIEFDDWDDYSEEDFPYTTNDADNGCVWLNAGWYEEVDCEKCDGYWSAPINIISWQPLPELPPAPKH